MLFATTSLAPWFQQLPSCVNRPHWVRSRILTCFILGSTVAFYLEFTLNPHDLLTSLRDPRTHPIPLYCNEFLPSSVIRIGRDRTPVNNPFARNAEHEQGGLPLTTWCFLGRSRRLYSSNSKEFESIYSLMSFSRYVEVYRAGLACSHTNQGCDRVNEGPCDISPSPLLTGRVLARDDAHLSPQYR